MLIFRKNVRFCLIEFLNGNYFSLSGFYLFLFAHPILIVKNPHWFTETKSSDLSIDNDMNRMQSSNSLQVLKYQLSILSKLYRNELQVRQPSANTSSLEKQTI